MKSASKRRKWAVAVSAALASMAVSVRASEITSTWGGNSGDWTDATQWSTNPNDPNNGTPSGVTYDALINAPGAAAYTVSLSTSITTDSVTLNSPNATLSQTGGELATTATLDFLAGTYNLSGAGLETSSYIGGGTLTLNNAVAGFGAFAGIPSFDNTGGTIIVGTGSTFAINFSDNVATGTLTPVQLGNLVVDGGGVTLVDVTINNNGQTLSFSNAAGVHLLGTTVNGGEIDFPAATSMSHVALNNVTLGSDISDTDDSLILQGVNAQGHTINLVQHASVLAIAPTSNGASSVTLSNAVVFLGNGAGVAAIPFSGNAAPALTLGSNTLIHGFGDVGFSPVSPSNPSLNNQGTISADQNGQTLRIAPLVFTNIGTLQAIYGGVLNIDPTTTTFTNNGILFIDSLSTIRAPQGITFAGGSSFDVTLAGNGASGILQISHGLIFQNNVSLNLSLASGAIFSGPHEIISYLGDLRGAFSEVTPGFALDYSQPGEILVTAIPEPCAIGFLGMSACLILARRRRPVRRGDLPRHH